MFIGQVDAKLVRSFDKAAQVMHLNENPDSYAAIDYLITATNNVISTTETPFCLPEMEAFLRYDATSIETRNPGDCVRAGTSLLYIVGWIPADERRRYKKQDEDENDFEQRSLYLAMLFFDRAAQLTYDCGVYGLSAHKEKDDTKPVGVLDVRDNLRARHEGKKEELGRKKVESPKYRTFYRGGIRNALMDRFIEAETVGELRNFIGEELRRIGEVKMTTDFHSRIAHNW